MSQSAVEDFSDHLAGAVIRPDDPAYEETRTVWNAMIDRRPAVIVVAKGPDDIVAAVNHARDSGMVVSIRGGGHNIAGTAVCDGGVMIDLSAMRGVDVDAGRRVARVQGGATLADLDAATQEFGLAAPGGVVSSTGVAGLTLGGGFGWLSRLHGLAADNLIAADLVTADGRQVRASEQENPELFWGLRGGGGNFGVVTSFEFRLHAVGPEVLFGPTVFRLEDAGDVLRHYRQFAAGAPREVCVWADLLTAPPLPFLPEQYHGTKVLSLMQCFAGDIAEGEAALAPLREFGRPVGDAVGPMPFADAQQILDGAYPKGARNYWSASNHHTLTDATIDRLVALAASLPTPESDILICQLGGAIGDVAPDATAYPHRDIAFSVTPGARWLDPAQDEQCLRWVREDCAVLSEHAAGGAYSNFIAEAHGRTADAYGANYERLAALKTRWDPGNLFRLNQNVRPAD